MAERPRCPKCGEPARYVRMLARMLYRLLPDGELGKIERSTLINEPSEVRDREYECGLGHRWRTE